MIRKMVSLLLLHMLQQLTLALKTGFMGMAEMW